MVVQCSPTIFPFPPSTFCRVCKFICTFRDPAFIHSLNVSICGKQDPSSLTGSLHTSLVSIEMDPYCIGILSVQSTWLIGSCALYHPTLVQCHSSMGPVWSHRLSSTLLQGPMQQLQSHFKLNQVIETWDTSSIPLSLFPSSRVKGLSPQSWWLCGWRESNPGHSTLHT